MVRIKSMDFSSQPEELVIQQLSQLPVKDILNACQGNKRVAQICSGPVLWRMKLQMDFPGVDVRIPNPKEIYLKLIDERAKEELNSALYPIPWIIGLGVQANFERIYEILNTYKPPEKVLEAINRLNQPISGLHRLVIYYPVEYRTKYLHRIEYGTNKAIIPQQVLESIEDFYDQPFTQENADAIIAITMYPGSHSVHPGSKIRDTLFHNFSDYSLFQGLKPYKDGFTLYLKS